MFLYFTNTPSDRAHNRMPRADSREQTTNGASTHMAFFTGRLAHPVASAFDLSPLWHSVQLFEPYSLLNVPLGHFTHSQQHTTGVVCNVPGEHSSLQTDWGIALYALLEFQEMWLSFNSSTPSFHEPTCVSSRPDLFWEELCMLIISYDANMGSPF